MKKAVELEHISIEFDHENGDNLLLGAGQVIREEDEGNVKEDLMREIEVYQEKLAGKEQLAEQLQKVVNCKWKINTWTRFFSAGNGCELPAC